MNALAGQVDHSWFRSAAGLRFGLEIAVIVLAKLAALILLYVVFIAPQPRAAVSPVSMRAHVLSASSGDQAAQSVAP
jgi:hypothetical protein